MFFEECKHVLKKKMAEYITDEIEIHSDDCDRQDCYEESSNEKNSDGGNVLKKTRYGRSKKLKAK